MVNTTPEVNSTRHGDEAIKSGRDPIYGMRVAPRADRVVSHAGHNYYFAARAASKNLVRIRFSFWRVTSSHRHQPLASSIPARCIHKSALRVREIARNAACDLSRCWRRQMLWKMTASSAI